MVAIARALLNENRILLVDEPTKGLAPMVVNEVAAALEQACQESTVLLVEQNLAVVRRLAEHVVVLDTGRVVYTGLARELLDDRDARVHRRARLGCAAGMSTVVLLAITGLGLGAMYFLIASGLSLIYGLMGVLNFAHGAFLTVGAYAMWYSETKLDAVPVVPRFILAALVGLVVGTIVAALVELFLIRPLYGRHIEQVLVTVGLGLCITALIRSIWGPDPKFVALPPWTRETTSVLGASIPNDRWIEIITAALVLLGPQPVPAPHPLRADRPRRRREPGDGDRARDRRPSRVHPRLRDRRGRRRPRRASCRRSTSARSTPSAARAS